MYEQNKVSVVGRIVWFAVLTLIIGGLVWFLLWLFVWRTSGNDATTGKQNTATTQKVTSPTAQTGDTTADKSNQPSSNATTGVASGDNTNATLANTGPGSLTTPIAIAVVGGTVYYHLRLRRKLQR